MNQVERTVESLAGDELSAVSFVRDYIEFHFDGPVLRALTNPRVEIDGETTAFPEQGSRDRLCALIGRAVRQVDARDGVHIRLAFEGGVTLTLPLDEASHVGPEAAHFQSHLTARPCRSGTDVAPNRALPQAVGSWKRLHCSALHRPPPIRRIEASRI